MTRVVFALLLLLSPAGLLQAEYTLDPALEQEAQYVFGQVLSPFCPGKLLQDCPSRAASKLKEDIRKKIDEGKSREDVIQELYAIYGEEISAVPRTTGFGLVAWITPALFVLIGFVGLIAWLRSRQQTVRALSEGSNPLPLDSSVNAEIDKLMNE